MHFQQHRAAGSSLPACRGFVSQHGPAVSPSLPPWLPGPPQGRVGSSGETSSPGTRARSPACAGTHPHRCWAGAWAHTEHRAAAAWRWLRSPRQPLAGPAPVSARELAALAARSLGWEIPGQPAATGGRDLLLRGVAAQLCTAEFRRASSPLLFSHMSAGESQPRHLR